MRGLIGAVQTLPSVNSKLRRLRALEFAATLFILSVDRTLPSGEGRGTTKRLFRLALDRAANAIKQEERPT